MIELAIKDLERIDLLEGRSNLTGYESELLLRLTTEEHPAAFLEGVWFEEICGLLNVEPDVIRGGLRARRIAHSDK